MRKLIRTIWQPLKRPLLVIVALLMVITLFESITKGGMSEQPRDDFIPNVTRPQTAVVLINGAGMPQMVFEEHRAQFASMGNLHEIVFPEKRFNREKVVELIIRKVKRYQHVTFVGASMGGMIAHDVIQTVRLRNDRRHFGLILIDSPTGKWEEIELPVWGPLEFASKFASCYPFGLLSNTVLSSGRPDGDLNDIHPRNKARVLELWDAIDAYPFSGRSDQGCYVFYHEALQPLADVTAVYIRSTKDTFTLDNALDNWRKLVPIPRERVLYVGARHMSFLDEPALYADAFQNAYALAA